MGRCGGRGRLPLPHRGRRSIPYEALHAKLRCSLRTFLTLSFRPVSSWRAGELCPLSGIEKRARARSREGSDPTAERPPTRGIQRLGREEMGRGDSHFGGIWATHLQKVTRLNRSIALESLWPTPHLYLRRQGGSGP